MTDLHIVAAPMTLSPEQEATFEALDWVPIRATMPDFRDYYLPLTRKDHDHDKDFDDSQA